VDEVRITGSIAVGPGRPLLVIAGPCVIESEQMCLEIARQLLAICRSQGLPYVFKASFDKANRTSLSSYRGPGIKDGLRILDKVKEAVDVPLLSDIHRPSQAAEAASVLDVLQIPALLCRQTDLLVAAADTGLPVNVKKGQFVAPREMRHVVEKVKTRGNRGVLLCERGSAFGYHNLVVDMRSIVWMRELGCPVIFDATHSTQRPGGLDDRSGGDREVAPALAAAAVAAGADGVYMEVHPDPTQALCDAATMLPLAEVAGLLEKLKSIAAAAGERP